ncbi:hypothetical protein [Roseimarinus sediminis]|uniref:hypothetical protein n=1 Tax=Roseimarinus sediminis TaxID=1610899 RepID=UPI003D1FBE6E
MKKVAQKSSFSRLQHREKPEKVLKRNFFFGQNCKNVFLVSTRKKLPEKVFSGNFLRVEC